MKMEVLCNTYLIIYGLHGCGVLLVIVSNGTIFAKCLPDMKFVF
jgi:hypothetical protein